MDVDLTQEAEGVAAVLKQLSHPARLKLLCCLQEGPKTVSELVSGCGASQSWVSQFLSRMRLEGLVESEREGKFVRYRIHDPRIKKLMRAIASIYCNKQKGE